MKRIVIALLLMLTLAAPASAVNSLAFSTPQGAAFSWQLMNVEMTWQLSFMDDGAIVDNSSPADPIAQGDFVSMPTMVLSDLTVVAPGILSGTLTPIEDLTIVSDTGDGGVSAGDTVMTASVAPGGFITAGTNFIAYSTRADDLDILEFAAGYGTIIPLLAANEASGLPLDLSFSGESITDLFSVLTSGNLQATAQGNVCGTIVAIPAPGTLLLVAVGTAITGWLRQRKLV